MLLLQKSTARAISLFVLIVTSTSQTTAFAITETYRVAPDSPVSINFGRNVAIDGDNILIGANRERADAGAGSSIIYGAAYLFDRETGEQINKFTSPDPIDGDYFGFGVAVEGDRTVIGSPAEAYSSARPAYVFQADYGEILNTLRPTYDPSISGNGFGYGIGLSNGIAIINSHNRGFPNRSPNTVHLFDIDTGQQLFQLTPGDQTESDSYGLSVAIGQNTAIVGAPYYGAGSAYLFDVTTGNEIAKLQPDDGEDGDSFGFSVSISGNIALVSAPSDIDNREGTGSAYLFDVTTGEQITKLAPSGNTTDFFGSSVSIDGNYALVGGSFFSMAAYLFNVTTGEEVAILNPSVNDANGFGGSVALDGTTAVIGAFEDKSGVGFGTAYIYDLSSLIKLPGDYNGDGTVSQSDLDLVLLNWGDTELPDGFTSATALDGGFFDGLISQNELDSVLLNWGSGSLPDVRTIPEPATLGSVLLLLGLGSVTRRRSA